MKKSRPEQNPWKYAGLASIMGGDLVACLLLGYFGGAYLADSTGRELWKAAGLLAGLIVGLVSIVLLIKRILEETNE